VPWNTLLLLTDPAHFGVTYTINPWMQPCAWAQDPVGHLAAARRSFQSLVSALTAAGARLEVMQGVAGLPDMVFPANAAVVLDHLALLARFRHPERQGEEQHFQKCFHALMKRGLLDEVAQFPPDCFQEGAGDCIWTLPAAGSGPAMVNARHARRYPRSRPSLAGKRPRLSLFRVASITSTSVSARYAVVRSFTTPRRFQPPHLLRSATSWHPKI